MISIVVPPAFPDPETGGRLPVLKTRLQIFNVSLGMPTLSSLTAYTFEFQR